MLVTGCGPIGIFAVGICKAAGASRAVLSFLRLPEPVNLVFEERLRAAYPLRTDRILSRVQEAGAYTKMVAALYEATCRRIALPYSPPGDDRANTPHAGPLEHRTFQRSPVAGRQLSLF